jgi:hypothetical protein
VPSQRSSTYQAVPRTVATLLPPRVRKLPLLSRPHSRRGGLRFFLLVAAARAPAWWQPVSAPRRTSSVRPPAPWGWRTSNRPPWKIAAWVEPLASAVRRVMLPSRVSRIEPTGSAATSDSAT